MKYTYSYGPKVNKLNKPDLFNRINQNNELLIAKHSNKQYKSKKITYYKTLNSVAKCQNEGK